MILIICRVLNDINDLDETWSVELEDLWRFFMFPPQQLLLAEVLNQQTLHSRPELHTDTVGIAASNYYHITRGKRTAETFFERKLFPNAIC